MTTASTASTATLRLQRHLATLPPLAVAVSGGVDSLTLAVLAHRSGADAHMVHASSPAVPAEATERVRSWAEREGWSLAVVDAAEFGNADYLANPVNRCFHCKSQLYTRIRATSGDRLIVSGANVDDLGEYRPGLDAARDHGVRHPYVEFGIDKRGVRTLAHALGLGDAVAELPSAPCLASRVETGIRIHAPTLGYVHAVETLVTSRLRPATVRCRIRANGVVIELDAGSLAALAPEAIDGLQRDIAALPAAPPSAAAGVRFARYRNGSAFLTGASA